MLPTRCVAYMLTNMSSAAAALIRDVRSSTDLSVRALAERAGVAGSTISRIEAGEVDPGIETVARLLAACGRKLELVVEPATTPTVRALSSAWSTGEHDQPRPNWTRLRAFLDYLALHPDQRGPATVDAPRSGSPLIDNLLAGIAETESDTARLRPPRWTTRVEPLPSPWVAPGTPRMQAEARAHTPPRLLARNLILSRDSLWRDRSIVGV